MSLDQVSFVRLEKKKEQFLWQHVAFGEAPGRQPGQGVEGEVRHPKEAGESPVPGGQMGALGVPAYGAQQREAIRGGLS